LLHAAFLGQHSTAFQLLLAVAPCLVPGSSRNAALLTACPQAGAGPPLIAAHERQQLAAARVLVLAAAGSAASLRLGLQRLLLDAVRSSDERQLRALLWVAAAGDEGVPSLLTAVIDGQGRSLLHMAINNMQMSIARLLVQAAPQLATRPASCGWTPLHLLASRGGMIGQEHLELLQLLLAVPGAAEAVDGCGQTPLHMACQTDVFLGGADALVSLMAAAAPATVSLADEDGNTPVHLAVGFNQDMLQALVVAAPVQVAATLTAATGTQTPLQLAVGRRNWVSVTQLLQAVMQTSNSDGQDGPAISLQLLLQACPDPANLGSDDGEDSHIIHAAARLSTAGVLNLLLTAQLGDATAVDESGGTPLHHAAYCGSTEAVRLLLGAAPSTAAVADGDGQTPLHVAAQEGCLDVVKLLLAAAPQTASVADEEGQLPLHCAANCSGHPAVVAALLEAAPHAASLTAEDGFTPLELAFHSGNMEAACVLLEGKSTPVALAALAAAPPDMQHLFARVLAARLPLSEAEWNRVPSPCPGLGRALLPALQHSPEQARQLVRHLPAADAERLRAALLVLGRAHGCPRHRLHLPGPLAGRILSLALDD
jgi:ankyrin repeat protein